MSSDVTESVRPISEAQRHAAESRSLPEPELVRDDVWSLAMPMPGDIVGYTLSVVLAPQDAGATIIDPGWGSDAALERVRQFFTSVGRSIDDLSTIILTHAHPDHSGLSMALRESTGAAIAMHVAEQRSIDSEAASPVYSFERLREWGVSVERARALLVELEHATQQDLPRADRLLRDGEELVAGDRALQVVHAAGHTPGHVGLVSPQDAVLFSGDLVLPTVFPGLGLGSDTERNALSDYLTSLNRMQPFDDYEVVPGHGYRFHGLRPRRREASAYMLRRAREVEHVIAVHPAADVATIASRLSWRAGWQRIEASVMLSTALRQTEQYRDFVVRGGWDDDGAVRGAR